MLEAPRDEKLRCLIHARSMRFNNSTLFKREINFRDIEQFKIRVGLRDT